MKILVVVTILLISTLGAVVSKRTMSERGKSTLELRVVQGTVTRAGKSRVALERLPFDSVPVLTDEDVEWYRYSDGGSRPSHKIELYPQSQERLRRRVHDLYYRSFVVFVSGRAVYGGVFLPNVPAGSPPSHTYVGPLIRLPGSYVRTDRVEYLGIGFTSDGEIWLERDDPRDDKAVMKVFRDQNKLTGR